MVKRETTESEGHQGQPQPRTRTAVSGWPLSITARLSCFFQHRPRWLHSSGCASSSQSQKQPNAGIKLAQKKRTTEHVPSLSTATKKPRQKSSKPLSQLVLISCLRRLQVVVCCVGGPVGLTSRGRLLFPANDHWRPSRSLWSPAVANSLCCFWVTAVKDKRSH